VLPSRNEDALEGYNTWKQKPKQQRLRLRIPYGVTRYDGKTEAQLREIVDDGTASSKSFSL